MQSTLGPFRFSVPDPVFPANLERDKALMPCHSLCLGCAPLAWRLRSEQVRQRVVAQRVSHDCSAAPRIFVSFSPETDW
jgi:hypothetical protein